MSIITKPIPTKLQRLAAELPCDGVKRYKVGKKDGLSYSEARAAILAEGDVGPNDRGGRILKRGTANRLAELNKRYFRIAAEFIGQEIKRKQEELAAKQADASAAPQTPEEIDDGGAAGTEVNPNNATSEPVPEQATMAETLPQPVIAMAPGDKHQILDKNGTPVGTLTRNKNGFRCVIDGQEARSRNPVKMAELISNALEGHDWSTKAVVES